MTEAGELGGDELLDAERNQSRPLDLLAVMQVLPLAPQPETVTVCTPGEMVIVNLPTRELVPLRPNEIAEVVADLRRNPAIVKAVEKSILAGIEGRVADYLNGLRAKLPEEISPKRPDQR
ncbi:MAG TPA: hypothetical protein VIK52_14250 [Opitutaceae bacterium]